MKNIIKYVLLFGVLISLTVVFLPDTIIPDHELRGKIRKVATFLFFIFGYSFKIYFLESENDQKIWKHQKMFQHFIVPIFILILIIILFIMFFL